MEQGGEMSLSSAALVELMTAVLDKGRSFRFLAKGFSMSPFIKDGDVVTVSPFLGRKVRLGEVVAFISPQTHALAVHRIIRKQQTRFLLQGDNVPEADGTVSAEKILGFVERVERQGRDVNLGLGPERRVIAFLNRKGWLFQVRYVLWRLLRPLRDGLRRIANHDLSDKER